MSNLEKKIDLLVSLVLAEDEESRKSIKSALAEEMSQVSHTSLPQLSAEEETESLLLEMGVPCRLLGHQYMVSAICMLVENPDAINAITSEVYPVVADQCHTSASRVERAIRHGIEVAWDRGDLDVFAQYFGNTVSALKGRPTNGEFLAQCAHHIRHRLGK